MPKTYVKPTEQQRTMLGGPKKGVPSKNRKRNERARKALMGDLPNWAEPNVKLGDFRVVQARLRSEFYGRVA